MQAANFDCLDRFFNSETLCLENCHDDRTRSFASEDASDNIFINQNAAPGHTIDSITTDLSHFQLALSDLIRQVESGALEYWSAFYTYSKVTNALYKRREESTVKPLLYSLLRGLWRSLVLQCQPMETPFLQKLIALLESQNHFLDAIAICDYATDKNIPDSSQSGYEGRKRRIENKLKKGSENSSIDWNLVRRDAHTFFGQSFKAVPKKTDKIESLAKRIKRFLNKAKKLSTEIRVKEFHIFKHQILPEIEAGMVHEKDQASRASWDSYSWLYKELFKLEGDYWAWCGQPILAWYRDTEQAPDTWPIWLLREYGWCNQIEFKLYSNNEPFTARDLYALTDKPLTDWGMQHGFSEILSDVEEWLKVQRNSNGKCFVRAYFEDTSYWSAGELSQTEDHKHRKTFEDLIEIGTYKSKRSLLDQPLNMTPSLFGAKRTLYDFPMRMDSHFFWLPEIPKLNLAEEIQKIFRQAENDTRSQAGLPDVGAGWISEAQLVAFISKSFPDEIVVTQASPPWLERQRFDVYLPKRKIAIEYQGIQHFEPVDFFGGEEGFKNTQERDASKRRKCKENGCSLIEVLPDYDEKKLVGKIHKIISLTRA